MQIELSEIESTYSKRVVELFSNENSFNANSMLELSKELFEEISVEGISNGENPSGDMLLFQYGVYDWGDDHGEHFSFDITRQLIIPNDDEPYQLNLTLVYPPEPFRGTAECNFWSDEFYNLEDFITDIKSTAGFNLASKFTPIAYNLVFSQC